LISLSEAGFAGFNVTFPLKAAVVLSLAEISELASRLQAVNTLVRIDSVTGALSGSGPVGEFPTPSSIQFPGCVPYRGENTDGDGFCMYLEREQGVSVSESRFLLLGAGKTSRSILLALEARGVRDVRMINRSREKLEDAFMAALKARQPGWTSWCQADLSAEDYTDLFDVDWIVHATSLGLSGAGADFPWPLDRMPNSARVVDLNYLAGASTPFLVALPKRIHSLDGSGMLAYQAACAFEFWWGFFPRMDGVLERLSRGP